MKKFNTVVVIGAGAFGTAIGSVLANNFKKVIMKVRSRDVYDGILKGENTVYLPGHKLPKNIDVAISWDEVDSKVEGKVDLIVSGLPTGAIASYLTENNERILKYLENKTPIVSLAKGIDPNSLELPDDLFFDRYANYRELFVFLSGPSFAKEILAGQITLVTVAGRSKRVLQTISKMLETNYFKVMMSYDVKGVLLGGALKNVLAIAGGIIEGLGLNHNTRAAMITRGIVEMHRFGRVYNARPETFYGLSGMGDLILTTTGDLSRNKRFGLEIAKGRQAEEIISSQRSVVEGYKTAKAAYLVSEKYDIRAQIFKGVYGVLFENLDPKKEIGRIMKMPSGFELE